MISIDRPPLHPLVVEWGAEHVSNAICTSRGWLVTLASRIQCDTYLVNNTCTYLTRGNIFVDFGIDDKKFIRFPEFNSPALFFTNEGNLSPLLDNLFIVQDAHFGCHVITKSNLSMVGNFVSYMSSLNSLVCFGYNLTKPCLIVADANRRVEILYPDDEIRFAFAGYDDTILVVTETKFLILDNPLI